MAEIVYPPVIVALKTFWKYLGLQFNFEGDAHIPRKGGAILAMGVDHPNYSATVAQVSDTMRASLMADFA